MTARPHRCEFDRRNFVENVFSSLRSSTRENRIKNARVWRERFDAFSLFAKTVRSHTGKIRLTRKLGDTYKILFQITRIRFQRCSEAWQNKLGLYCLAFNNKNINTLDFDFIYKNNTKKKKMFTPRLRILMKILCELFSIKLSARK